jgi:ribosomal protein L44E
MLNFSAYKGRDKQNFLSMLNQCEAAGVTDIRFVRQRLQESIEEQFRDELRQTGGIAKRKRERREFEREVKRLQELPECPSCGKGKVKTSGQDGFRYEICIHPKTGKAGCGWSRMV